MARTILILILLDVLVFCFSAVNAKQKRTLAERLKAKDYLKRYHYLSPLNSGNHNMKIALEMYQRFMHLPVTKELDDATYREMGKPRCGSPDFEEEDDSGSGKQKRFGIYAHKWSRTALTYGFENYGKDMSRSQYESIIAKAFKMWSDKSVLTFSKLSSAANADIKIAFRTGVHKDCTSAFDGPGAILAHADYPTGGNLHFDDDESFTDGTSKGNNLLAIAVHEIGHVIGILHNSKTASIMYPTYKGYDPNLQLDADDINAASRLYGGGTVQPSFTKPIICADKYGSCKPNKDKCHQSQYAAAMRDNCPSTCGYCKGGAGQVLPSCKDKYTANLCSQFKQASLCGMSRIRKNCLKTCTTCT